MTEADWKSCVEPQAMLDFLRNSGKFSERKARLFAVASFRSVWHLMADKCSRRAVEVAERFADGHATPQTLQKWHWAAYEAYMAGRFEAAYAANCATHPDVALAAFDTSVETGDAGLARRVQCDLFRDIIANPFQLTPSIDKSWLSWNDGTVRKLAQAAYDERVMPGGTLDRTLLAILADALEEAGCSDEKIIGHLRSSGPHIRGCWVVDLLLDKS